MRLIQVKKGLLEAENFFLASSFSDYAGSANVTRDTAEGTVSLNSNDRIERKFHYQECVVEVKKKNFSNIEEGEKVLMYLGDENKLYGIKDDEEGQNPYWKIALADGYIQVYSSPDGAIWSNLTGQHLEGIITRQGFKKQHKEPLVLENYTVYSSPYVTLLNMIPGTKVQLFNDKNEKLDERVFDEKMEAKVWLDSNMKGYFKFIDESKKEIFSTELMELVYGDVYIASEHNLQVIYRGKIVEADNPSMLADLCEGVTVKNADNKTYRNVKIGSETSSDDLIELSFDGITFENSLIINELVPSQEKEMIIRVTKNVNNHNFGVRDFNLTLEVGDIVE